jgi:DNA-binding response OmpR family regulator
MRAGQAARKRSISRGKRILLVDDEASVREMVGRVLMGEGFNVLLAGDGPEALRVAAANPIDLVLLDLNMPGLSGWDTFEKLTRENPFLAVIIITARPNQLFTAVGAGVGALLEKPLDFPTLLETVRTLLAESDEMRLARLTGERGAIHYQPTAGRDQ